MIFPSCVNLIISILFLFDVKKSNVTYCVLFLVSIACSKNLPISTLSNVIRKYDKEFNNTITKKLTYDLIKPLDHLSGIKMERDGHLNKQFRKEIIIGNSEKEESDDDKLLTDIFSKADNDNDKHLSQNELQDLIASNVKEHFNKAIRENIYIFFALDKNHNGRVSWDEYHTNFMLEQGFNKTYATKHPENHKSLQRKLKERILLDKAAWSEAANSDPDALNIDEFLTFRHPEHSHVTLLNMVNDIMSSLDMDGDEVLTEEEFSELPDSEEMNMTHSERKMERIKEFRESIDIDHDGKVNRQELLMYNDPENLVYSKTEARKLILLADINKDNLLSLREILDKKSLFLGSKMVDSERSFHDEF